MLVICSFHFSCGHKNNDFCHLSFAHLLTRSILYCDLSAFMLACLQSKGTYRFNATGRFCFVSTVKIFFFFTLC